MIKSDSSPSISVFHGIVFMQASLRLRFDLQVKIFNIKRYLRHRNLR